MKGRNNGRWGQANRPEPPQPWRQDLDYRASKEYTAGVKRMARAASVVAVRQNILTLAEEGWRALEPLFRWCDPDTADAPPAIVNAVRILQVDFTFWVRRIAALSESEGAHCNPRAELLDLLDMVYLLALFHDHPGINPEFRLLLDRVGNAFRDYRRRFDALRAELDRVDSDEYGAQEVALRQLLSHVGGTMPAGGL